MCLDKVTEKDRVAKKDMEIWKVVSVNDKGTEYGCYTMTEFKRINRAVKHDAKELRLTPIDEYSPEFHCFINRNDAVAYLEEDFRYVNSFCVNEFIIPKGSKLTYGEMQRRSGVLKCVVSDTLINPRAQRDKP